MRRMVVSVLTLLALSCAMAFSQSELHQTFDNVKMLMPMGDGYKATNVMVKFESSRLVVSSMNDQEDYMVFPYSNIRSASYTFSKGPRYQGTPAMMAAANFLAIPLFVTKVERHRLEVQSDQASVLLDLNKDNYKVFLKLFEVTTGRKVAADGVLSSAQGIASIGTH
jgi:hypothetical protein